MKIGLVRRGYSGSGGAERYTLRFAEALREAGHEALLFTSAEWPASTWNGDLIRVPGQSPRAFADGLQALNPREHCDLLFSLERVWDCDACRAGDGVHRAWLERRRPYEGAWRAWFRQFQRKHQHLLDLERALFDPSAQRLIIANSQMVRQEITRIFHVAGERIKVVPNGLPPAPAMVETREETRARLGIAQTAWVVLFAGSGWERKGLRFAMEGINRVAAREVVLLVAGSGKRTGLPVSTKTVFLGEVGAMPPLMAAADVFLLPTIYDPFSNASLEALAAGLPVITTAANGFSEIMRPGLDGDLLSSPAAVEEISALIEKWRERESAEMRLERQAHARFYTMERNVRATMEALLPLSGAPIH